MVLLSWRLFKICQFLSQTRLHLACLQQVWHTLLISYQVLPSLEMVHFGVDVWLFQTLGCKIRRNALHRWRFLHCLSARVIGTELIEEGLFASVDLCWGHEATMSMRYVTVSTHTVLFIMYRFGNSWTKFSVAIRRTVYFLRLHRPRARHMIRKLLLWKSTISWGDVRVTTSAICKVMKCHRWWALSTSHYISKINNNKINSAKLIKILTAT